MSDRHLVEKATLPGAAPERRSAGTGLNTRVVTRLLLAVFVRVRRFVRSDDNFMLLLAALVGAAGAVSVIGFRSAVAGVRTIVWGWPADLSDHVLGAPWWQVLLIPTLGGIAVGWWVQRALGGHAYGVMDVVYSTVNPKERMRTRRSLSTALGGAVSIGTGASIGREGVLVQLGAALTVSFCRRLRMTPALSRSLMGAGVAAVMAAQFNAPLAGTFFALELVLRDYLIRSLAPTVVAAVVGTTISRGWYGDFPAFTVARTPIVSAWEFPVFALLGLLAALVALLFMRNGEIAAARFRDWFPNRVLRTACGGFLIGALGLAVPNVLGTGYGTISEILAGRGTIEFLAMLLVAKSLATSISVGSGFVGGDFSASLLIGATTGALFAAGIHAIAPATSSTELYALIGMGAVAAAVMGAPMTTILIISELTADFSITLAVMIAVVIASAVVQSVYGRSAMEWKLARRM
jgi:chloride channel protein, CIC family